MTGWVIQTQRLEMYRPQPGDLEGMYALVAHPETRRFLGPTEPSMADTFARLLRNAGSWTFYGYGTFIVRLKGQQGILGTCGIFRSWRGFGPGLTDGRMDDVPEAGWVINVDHWGKGYAREAMTAVLEWFDAEHGSQRTVCMIEEGHSVSAGLAVSLGFSAYGRHDPEDGSSPLILYERLPT